MFLVEWLEEALEELTVLWSMGDADLRKAIMAATSIIDQELKTDPYRQSESRGDENRVLFVYPLGVLFEIDPQDRIVRVLNVWRFRRLGE